MIHDADLVEKYIEFVAKRTGAPIVPTEKDGFTPEEIERFDELSAQTVATYG